MSHKRILVFWAVVFGISALACGDDSNSWEPPDIFESGSSGEFCGNQEQFGEFHGYCSNPDERCIHNPNAYGGSPNESDCGEHTGRCVKPVRDRFLANPPDDVVDKGPVCGCDGETYATPYDALDEGVSIDKYGGCPQPSRDNCGPTIGSCADGETCLYPKETSCGQDGDGTCRIDPKQCPYISDPVCGCDGETYRNECKARENGISIKHAGDCDSGQSMKLDLPEAPKLSRPERASLLPHVSYSTSVGQQSPAPEETPASSETTR